MSVEKPIKVKATFHNRTEFFDVIEIVDKNNYLIVNNKNYDDFQISKNICEVISTEETPSDLEYKHLAGIWAMGQIAYLNDTPALAACVEVVMREYYKQNPELIEDYIDNMEPPKKGETVPNKDSNKEDLQAALDHAYEIIAEYKEEIIELRTKIKPNYWPTAEAIKVAANLQATSMKDNTTRLAEFYAFIKGVDWVKAKLHE